MIILKLKAGLGNQLFEYACARAKALRSNTDLYLDISWYSNIDPKDTVRTYGLGVYNISAKEAPLDLYPRRFNKYYRLYRKISAKIQREIFGKNDYTFDPKIAQAIGSNQTELLEGHFNSEKYFNDYSDIIRQELTLKEPLGPAALHTKGRLEQLSADGKILVLIHVRRGDYVTNPNASKFHGVQTSEYYSRALQKMKEVLSEDQWNRVHFILVSDSIDTLKLEIVPLLEKVPYDILSNPEIKNYEEIYLMSLCHHFIIANSSFSWWGAWLSTSSGQAPKVVIGPRQWVADTSIKTPDVMPENWIRV